LLVLIGHLGLAFSALATAQGFDAETHHHASLAPEDGNRDALGDTSCDHCCHAPAHLLGVLPHHPKLPLSGLSVPRAGYKRVWHSHIASPPVRPPKTSL